MAHQNKYLERKNEIDKSLDEIQHSEMTQNESKEVRYTSGLLSVAFYLSTIYLVLFISYFALSGNAWGLFILIFLGQFPPSITTHVKVHMDLLLEYKETEHVHTLLPVGGIE